MNRVVLLVDTSSETVAVEFPDRAAAREWEDKHWSDLTVLGVCRVVTRVQALRVSK